MRAEFHNPRKACVVELYISYGHPNEAVDVLAERVASERGIRLATTQTRRMTDVILHLYTNEEGSPVHVSGVRPVTSFLLDLLLQRETR